MSTSDSVKNLKGTPYTHVEPTHAFEKGKIKKLSAAELLATALLCTAIGHSYHPTRLDEEWIDMTVPDFQKLAVLAQEVLKEKEQENGVSLR